MARISTYVIDGTIVDGDKVIGSDANNDMQTKNYTVGDLVDYFAASIGGNFLVPYVGANDDVDLGAFNLSATEISVSGNFISDGSAGLPGQVLISQGPGSPAIWGFSPGTQDLSSVLNNGNTGSKNINLITINGYAKIDVEKAFGEPAMYLYSDTLDTYSNWGIDNLHLESPTYIADYLTNKIRYQFGGNYVDIIPNNYNNQAFYLPIYGGYIPISVNGNFADSSGNILVSGGGGGGVSGSGTTNYIPKWSSSTALTDSSIFDDGTNVGIGTATPSFKLDISGTGRFTGLLGAQGDFYAGAAGSSQFDINTLSATLPNTLGFWRKFGNGNYTYLKEDEQGGAQHKWAFVRRDGFNQTRAFYQANSSILNINLGWQDPNSSNYDGSTLLINPKINITNALNTGTIIRGTYYNPTLTSLVNTTHIAYQNTSGDIIHGNLATGGTAQMVTADTNGKLGTQTIPAGTITGSGTAGAIVKFSSSTAIGDATVDVDYMQQNDIITGYQLMGSTIKGTNLAVTNPMQMSTTTLVLTSGRSEITAIFIQKTTTITGVRWYQAANGSYTANNYNGVGLYSRSGGNLTLVASCANDGAIWQPGSGGWKNKAFSSTFTASRGVYYLAALYSSSSQTTAPGIGGTVAGAGAWATLSTVDFSNDERVYAGIGAQTSLVTPIALSTFGTGNSTRFGFYLY